MANQERGAEYAPDRGCAEGQPQHWYFCKAVAIGIGQLLRLVCDTAAVLIPACTILHDRARWRLNCNGLRDTNSALLLHDEGGYPGGKGWNRVELGKMGNIERAL